MQSPIQKFLERKWLVRGLIAVLLLILFYLSTISKTRPGSTSQAQPSPVPPTTVQLQSQSVEVQKAIAEQAQVDREYSGLKQTTHDQYPWINKMPFTSDKSFVYYDLEKDVFVGRLYPAAGDDIELLKADVLKRMKTEKEVPVENFTFEWVISP